MIVKQETNVVDATTEAVATIDNKMEGEDKNERREGIEATI